MRRWVTVRCRELANFWRH